MVINLPIGHVELGFYLALFQLKLVLSFSNLCIKLLLLFIVGFVFVVFEDDVYHLLVGQDRLLVEESIFNQIS